MKLRNKKTGEIFDLDKMPTWLKETIQLTATFYSRECEVYEPKEPLIKDEKIRKAVRAWAEANEVERVAVLYHSVWEASMTEIAKIDNASLKTVFLGDLGIKRGYTTTGYTITELCGEEE